jgi:hypothetical protein
MVSIFISRVGSTCIFNLRPLKNSHLATRSGLIDWREIRVFALAGGRRFPRQPEQATKGVIETALNYA